MASLTLNNKPYTKYLSKYHIVYARENDPEESLIIRDEYIGTVFKVFGICGVDKIAELYDGTLEDAVYTQGGICKQLQVR